MYYGTSVDAFLFMGQSTSEDLPDPGSDTYEEVPLLGTVTPPPHELSSAFFNVLNDGNKRSVGGKKADQLIEGDLVIDWDEQVHKDMYDDMQTTGGQKRNWYIQYPDGRTLKFVGFLTKWTEEPFDASADAKEHRAAFSISVDGAITVGNTGSSP